MLSAHTFQLTKDRHGQRKDIREVARISDYVWEMDEAKAHIWTSESGRTRWKGMVHEEPWRVVLRPTGTEQRSVVDYLLQYRKSGLNGRRVKAYLVFIQTEDNGVFYLGGVYSTLKAAKDCGPLSEGDFIAFLVHRGGARNVRFDRPDEKDSLWGLDTE